MKLTPPVNLAFTVLLLSACSPGMNDLVDYTNQIKQNTKVAIEPYPEFTTQMAFEYAAVDQRSPFKRPTKTIEVPVETAKHDCLQPNYNRKHEALEQYGIDALSLGGQFVSNNKKWVLFKTKDGGLFKATVGNYLGLFNGRITHINQTSVTINELVPDGAGCWQRKETKLTMSS